jgi:hypothetical protein
MKPLPSIKSEFFGEMRCVPALDEQRARSFLCVVDAAAKLYGVQLFADRQGLAPAPKAVDETPERRTLKGFAPLLRAEAACRTCGQSPQEHDKGRCNSGGSL